MSDKSTDNACVSLIMLNLWVKFRIAFADGTGGALFNNSNSEYSPRASNRLFNFSTTLAESFDCTVSKIYFLALFLCSEIKRFNVSVAGDNIFGSVASVKHELKRQENRKL